MKHMTKYATLLLALGLAACSESEAPVEPEPDPTFLPIEDLVEGTSYGEEVFPIGDTDSGGSGEPVAGVECIVNVNYHYHSHLSLFVNGERIAIAPGIGIVDPVIQDGFVEQGSCFYWLHTHDGSGLIHVEPPVDNEFTLGQLFTLWGQPLTSNNVAGFEGTLSVFVDGVRYEGDPAGIVFVSGKHISLQVGTPLAPLPHYHFQG